MKLKVNPCEASEPVYHTQWGILYNKPLPVKDRIMPTIRPYMNLVGSIPYGVSSYIPTPIITPSINYDGPFAMADLPRIVKPAPWLRIFK